MSAALLVVCKFSNSVICLLLLSQCVLSLTWVEICAAIKKNGVAVGQGCTQYDMKFSRACETNHLLVGELLLAFHIS